MEAPLKVTVYVTPDNTIGVASGDSDYWQTRSAVNLTVDEAKQLIKELQEAIALAATKVH